MRQLGQRRGCRTALFVILHADLEIKSTIVVRVRIPVGIDQKICALLTTYGSRALQ